MQQPSVGSSGPIIDSNLLAQIQTLTNQLLSKTEGTKQEPGGFNTVSIEPVVLPPCSVTEIQNDRVSSPKNWLTPRK